MYQSPKMQMHRSNRKSFKAYYEYYKLVSDPNQSPNFVKLDQFDL